MNQKNGFESLQKLDIMEEIEKAKEEVIFIFKEVIEGAFPIESEDGTILLEIESTRFESESRTFYSIVTLTNRRLNKTYTDEIKMNQLDEHLFSPFSLFSGVLGKSKKGVLIDPKQIEGHKKRMHEVFKSALNKKTAD